MATRNRVENGCRGTQSKDGTFSPHISKNTTERLARYCSLRNLNKTKFVEQCINRMLDQLEAEYYESLSKEELISLILGHKIPHSGDRIE